MMMQRIKIQVGQYREGELASTYWREVDAQVSGRWAAHKTFDESPWSYGGWSVTHVPSGMRAHSGMTKRDAVAAMKALGRDLNVDALSDRDGQKAADIMRAIGVWP